MDAHQCSSFSPSGGGSVVQRLQLPELERSSTTVSTHGKNRPSTEEEEFQWKFNYFSNECRLLGQYNCALSGKILLQGKMYISTTAVGFYSVFNDSTFISLIPTLVLFEYHEIVNITKRSNALVFNNSIEIELRDGTSYFFTSYVNREKAWALLMRMTHYQFGRGDESVLTARTRSKLPSIPRPGNNLVSGDGSKTSKVQVPVPSEVCHVLTVGYAQIQKPKLDYSLPMGIFTVPIERMYQKCVVEETYDHIHHTIANGKDIVVTNGGVHNCTAEPWASLPSSESYEFTRSISGMNKIENNFPVLRLPDYAFVTEDITFKINTSKQQFLRDSIVTTRKMPFSDCLKLHVRLVFTKLSASETQLDSEMEIIWVKKSILKSIIKSCVETEWITTNTFIRHAMIQACCDFYTFQALSTATPKHFTNPARTTYDIRKGKAALVPQIKKRGLFWFTVSVSLLISLSFNVYFVLRELSQK
ncbi:GRAM domain protein [Gregarina niphandrodes]|uniref:GRAM domain protein n=1 Tax=Gregarina niphandrodes TaxID=110365 RepID=A0A023B4J9_GRENI|nr:GRAM domain protein [Gregarina niphandrodes]EZG56858.1 GRAM domain protein [Gregarina niphandrodes]|eukprot:XP_011131124.1 GRAM domain protein [Gregarina niphandrodes]